MLTEPTRRWVGIAAGVLLGLAACGGDDDGDQADRDGEPESTDEAEVVDPYDGHTSDVYDGTTNWICHPDLDDDECRDLSVTEIAADGTPSRADLEPAEDPAVDCFYVYPTVSTDPEVNSDLEPNENELTTVGAQAAPFATSCRVFAPVYRQLTLNAITSGGFDEEEARGIAYGDVLDAWQTYISQHNDGRGVVLIGHSQGTGHLVKLMSEEIDPEPELRDRLVSAVVMGGTVTVPDGEVVGGSFENIPACESAEQTGCVINFSTYPADSPPVGDAIFGRVGGGPTPDGSPEDRAMCVDPVALAGGNGLADTLIPVAAPLIGGSGESSQLTADVETRYVSLPEALEASCERTGVFDYFAVGRASADDQRPIEALTAETLGRQWGLHLVDAQLPMGDLLEVVAAQAEAFTSG